MERDFLKGVMKKFGRILLFTGLSAEAARSAASETSSAAVYLKANLKSAKQICAL